MISLTSEGAVGLVASAAAPGWGCVASTGYGLIARVSCMSVGASSGQGQVARVPFLFVVASSACSAPEGAHGASSSASLTLERASLKSKGVLHRALRFGRNGQLYELLGGN